MFTYNERDLHRMPTPARSHFPIKQFIADSGLLDEDNARDNEADAALLRLPAPALRGTFAKAYTMLTRLVSQIGWDEMLRCRSQVFVMEEEYRAQKQRNDGSGTSKPQSVTTTLVEEKEKGTGAGTAVAPAASEVAGEESTIGDTSEANDLAAKAAEHPQDQEPKKQDEDVVANKLAALGVSDANGNSSSSAIPTIKISTDSDHEREKVHLEGFIKAHTEDKAGDANGVRRTATAHEAQSAIDEGEAARVTVEAPPLEKPALAQAQGPNSNNGAHHRSDSQSHGQSDKEAENQGTAGVEQQQEQQQLQNEPPHEQNNTTVGSLNSSFSFNNKRLCERWLDNLFMVLYEDLRVYTIWRAEVNHYKTQSLPYRKTSTEWEILGELALRLQHREEAKEALQRCVESKFSAKAYLRLMDMYAEERDVERCLWTALRLTAYHHRWYMEGTYPTAVAHNLFRLIRDVGLSKVNFTLVSMNPPEPVLRISECHSGLRRAMRSNHARADGLPFAFAIASPASFFRRA